MTGEGNGSCVRAGLFLGAAILFAVPAWAESPDIPPHVRLLYKESGDGVDCGGEATLRQWVKVRRSGAGDVSAEPSREPIELEIQVAKDPLGVRADVTVRKVGGAAVWSRTMVERSCADLTDRLVFTILLSLGVSSSSLLSEPAAVRSSEPIGGASPANPPNNANEVGKERRQRAAEIADLRAQLASLQAELRATKSADNQRWVVKPPVQVPFFSLTLGAHLSGNLTPHAGAGMWVGAEIFTEPVSLGLEVRVNFPSRVSVGSTDLDVSHGFGLLVPCARYRAFLGCLLLGAGAELRYDSAPLPHRTGTLFLPVVSIGGRLGVEVPLGEGHTSGRLFGEVVHLEPRSVVEYEGVRERWERPDIAAFLGIGLALGLAPFRETPPRPR